VNIHELSERICTDRYSIPSYLVADVMLELVRIARRAPLQQVLEQRTPVPVAEQGRLWADASSPGAPGVIAG